MTEIPQGLEKPHFRELPSDVPNDLCCSCCGQLLNGVDRCENSICRDHAVPVNNWTICTREHDPHRLGVADGYPEGSAHKCPVKDEDGKPCIGTYDTHTLDRINYPDDA